MYVYISDMYPIIHTYTYIYIYTCVHLTWAASPPPPNPRQPGSGGWPGGWAGPM